MVMSISNTHKFTTTRGATPIAIHDVCWPDHSFVQDHIFGLAEYVMDSKMGTSGRIRNDRKPHLSLLRPPAAQGCYGQCRRAARHRPLRAETPVPRARPGNRLSDGPLPLSPPAPVRGRALAYACSGCSIPRLTNVPQAMPGVARTPRSSGRWSRRRGVSRRARARGEPRARAALGPRGS